MDVSVRDLTAEDVDAFDTLLGAVEADHATSLRLRGPEFLEIRTLPGAVFLGGFDEGGAGDVVAWSGFLGTTSADGSQRFLLDGETHPDLLGRGLGTRMLEAALERARRTRAEAAPDAPAVYLYRGPAGRAAQRRLLGEHGLEPDRFRFLMVARLAAVAPTSAPPVPAGLELVPFDPRGSEAVRAVHNRAFAGYPNGGDADRLSWEGYLVHPPHVRHELSFLLTDPAGGGAVVAYLFGHEYAEPVSALPGVRELYVPYLGTSPEHRGRGLAGVLLGHAMHAARAAGFDTVSLDVDAANPTGALGLYERAGFEVLRRFDEYALREPGAAPAR
jgi:ribosomal protein S18 acetylase RimI-like enzyme